MRRVQVDSSMIKSVGYNPRNQQMEVEFQDESIYRFYEISEQTADELVKAPSIGKYFHKHVRMMFPYKYTGVQEVRAVCRNCECIYDPNKSKADLEGYCGQGCLHKKAKTLGWTNQSRKSEYRTLQDAGEVGRVEAED